MTELPSICVIIAARDAEPTIDAAIRSALADGAVTELVVVSDGSGDATAEVARAAGHGDPRLRVIELSRNIGPAAARNLAIAESRADLIAVLDADDRFLPGRLGRLAELPAWDLAADNVVFVTDASAVLPDSILNPAAAGERTLSLEAFALGNLARPGVTRGELGFLKPVISRDFLSRHRLSYDETLRLGEDYDLYVRALMAGARFRLTDRTGYLAQVRPDSLSGRHGARDLGLLEQALRRHLQAPNLTTGERHALGKVLKQVQGRHAHRAVLDVKAQQGLAGALRAILAKPSWLVPVAVGVARDKLRPQHGSPVPESGYRLLLEPSSS